jgi:rhamnosyltransferase
LISIFNKNQLIKLKIAIECFGILKVFYFVLNQIICSPRLWERFLITKVRDLNEINKVLKSIYTKNKYHKQDLVSVIVPVNNARSHGIERLVSSLNKQSYKNIEFIAVDSGSTDDTVNFLKKNQFKVLEIKPRDFTHAYSRNMGASIAKGKYLLFTVDDAIFDDNEWLYFAVGLLKYYKADSFSSLQSVDSKADAYAKILYHYLKSSQSDGSGFNISKTNLAARILFRLLPFRTKIKAIAIDDTNHLIRADVFKKIKYKLETVEDLEFGIRLTKQGYKFLYSNILTIRHYHKYPAKNLAKYAKRVYLDNHYFFVKVMPNYLAVKNRDSLVISGLLIHSEYLKVLARNNHKKFIKHLPHFLNSLNSEVNKAFKINMSKTLKKTWHKTLNSKTKSLYKSIFADEFPESYLFNNKVVNLLLNQFNNHVISIAFIKNEIKIKVELIIHIFNFLWVNRMMTVLSHSKKTIEKKLSYQFDNWKIDTWK